MKTPSVEPVQRGRLLPRISFRAALTSVTLCAVVAWCVRQAVAGSVLAGAVVAVLICLAACFAMYMVLFLFAWVPAYLGRDRWADVQRGNPFANGQLPPQILPPRSPGP